MPAINIRRRFHKLNLIWTEETVARLFEIGPQAYTPGTKMPEQTVGNAEGPAGADRVFARGHCAKVKA